MIEIGVSWEFLFVSMFNPLITSRFQRFSKIRPNWQNGYFSPHDPCAVKIHSLQGKKKPTPLWSKIIEITNYGIKYTSCQLKILQKTNLKVKISKTSMKFVLASHGRNLIRLEGMCLFTQDYAVVTFCQ